MKKPIVSILIIALVLAALFVFAACNTSDEVESLAFDTRPKAQYIVGEEISNFSITFKKGDKVGVLDYIRGANQIIVSGFDTSKAGSYEAVVSYGGKSIVFPYTVKEPTPEESAFNGGAGTQKEPYLIKTESAFLALDRFDTEGKYYELAADIAITQKRTASFVIEKEFSGVLSGGTAQHKITVNKTVNEENDLYLFKRLASATIRNLKLEFKANTAVTLALCAYGNNLFSNVDVYGKMHFSENDQCVYLQHNYDLTEDLKNVGERGAKTLFEYCDNYANVTSIANMGIFVGFANYLTFNEGENLGYLTLKNCKNYGTVSARNVGMLFSNATTPYVYNVTATNAINEGVINYLECGTPIGGAGYPDLPFEQMAYEIVADNVDNGANGQIEPIDALNATVNAKNKVSCFFSASVKKVIFVFEYQASVSYGEGIKYIRHVESVLTDAAATSVASSAEVASIVPLPAATVQTKGYRFIYDNEWRTETYNDVVCYIHSNGISFDSTLEQTVPAEDLNVYAFAYDASGTLLSATKVQ